MALFAFAYIAYQVTNWKIKDDYSVTVYQGGSKFVQFRGLQAVLLFDENDPGRSAISASIDAGSLDCEGNQALKDGARQPDALDVAQYPVISFKSTSISRRDSAATGVFKMVLFAPGVTPEFRYQATGDLTIKGVTRQIKIPFVFEGEVFSGGFTIDPKEYNITSVHFQKNLNIVLRVPVSK